ncbi:protein FAR1-RELATED SEQUENCE 8-like [Chenopodium quinoa]|uniref:FAR1 domain-containing protein n=1 Tax=Chenopodium quinoa TaxID=63459 RepID=A0A803MZF3_CHEQI|nr:protein FAR1-RELATED SEQUENCE 8-like [Chenopodium quinoa]
MLSSEVAEDVCVSLSHSDEGVAMDLINFEEGAGVDIVELCPYEDGVGMDSVGGDGGNMVNLNIIKIDPPPEVGMIFDSWEKANMYYNAFGKQEGFGVVLGQSAYKTLKDGRKVKSAVTWKCECVGFPDTRRRVGGKRLSKELEGEPVATKKSKKCGCEAGMYACLRDHGKWEIVRVELKHKPHQVSPSKSLLVTKYRLKELEKMSYVRRKLHFRDDMVLPAATMHKWLACERNGVENMPFTKKDVNNLMSRVKKLKLKDGDSNAMMNYFLMMQKNNKNFYRIHRLDANGVLQDVFWVDARSRAAYEDFGDVVCFDTTFLLNKYDLPFANIVGVIHHG